MKVMFLGETIKRRRLELGLTQEQLCEGICEPITISRLENGKQTPTRNRINAILERLDMPADRYYALLNKRELDIEAMQKQLTAYNIQMYQAAPEKKEYLRKMAFQIIQNMEAMIEDGDRVTRQQLLRSRLLLEKEENGYTPAEQRSRLLDALRMTSPSFALDEIEKGLFTTEELKIINQIAITFQDAQRPMESIEIWTQLYRYIQKHFHNIPSTKAHLNMVAFNYATALIGIGEYQRALEIAEEGRRVCLDNGHYLSLAGLLDVMAEAYHFLGDDEKSKELYYQCYYLSKAINDTENLKYTQKDAMRYHGLKFEY